MKLAPKEGEKNLKSNQRKKTHCLSAYEGEPARPSQQRASCPRWTSWVEDLSSRKEPVLYLQALGLGSPGNQGHYQGPEGQVPWDMGVQGQKSGPGPEWNGITRAEHTCSSSFPLLCAELITVIFIQVANCHCMVKLAQLITSRISFKNRNIRVPIVAHQ